MRARKKEERKSSYILRCAYAFMSFMDAYIFILAAPAIFVCIRQRWVEMVHAAWLLVDILFVHVILDGILRQFLFPLPFFKTT